MEIPNFLFSFFLFFFLDNTSRQTQRHLPQRTIMYDDPDKDFSSDMIRADPLSNSRGLFKSKVYVYSVPDRMTTSTKISGLSVASPIVSFGEDSSSGPMFKCGCNLYSGTKDDDLCNVCSAYMDLQDGLEYFARVINKESMLKDSSCRKGPIRDFRTRVQVNLYVNTFSSKTMTPEDISDDSDSFEGESWPTYTRNQGDFSNDKRERTLNEMYPPIGKDSIRGKRKTIVTPKKSNPRRRRLVKHAVFEAASPEEEEGEGMIFSNLLESQSISPKTPPNTPQRKRRVPAAPTKKNKKKRKRKAKEKKRK